MADERFMRHHYGPSGFVDKSEQEEHRCPACGNTKIPKPEWWAVKQFRDKLMAYVQNRRLEFREVAESSNKRGLEAKKLAAECRELAYFDVVKEIERIEVELADLIRRDGISEVRIFDLVAETRNKLQPFLRIGTFETGTTPTIYLAVDIILQEAFEAARHK